MLAIERSVTIRIDEAGLKQLIIDKVHEVDPSIVIDEIVFTQRRNPTLIDTEVKAHMENHNLPSMALASTKAKGSEGASRIDSVSDSEGGLDSDIEGQAEDSEDLAAAFLARQAQEEGIPVDASSEDSDADPLAEPAEEEPDPFL